MGLNDILMITGRNKRALEDHFDRVPTLEATLEAKGDTAKLESIQAASNLGDIHYVRQGDPMGLGHAVLRAKQHVGHEPFAVLLGDDLIDARDELLSTMIEVQAKTGGSVVALIEVDPPQISSYGCADVEAVEARNTSESSSSWRSPTWTRRPPTWPHRPLRPAPGGVRGPRAHRARPRRRNPAHRRPAGTLRRRGGRLRRVRRWSSVAADYDTGTSCSYLKACVRLACDSEDLGPACATGCPVRLQPDQIIQWGAASPGR